MTREKSHIWTMGIICALALVALFTPILILRIALGILIVWRLALFFYDRQRNR